MKDYPLVSIIVVNYNGKKYLKGCFGSLYNLNYSKNKLEIIMVDNGSSDDSVEFVSRNFPQVKIIKNDINNYSRANNLGIKHAKGKYIALLNNDTKVDQNWLIELVKVIATDKTIGVVGSKILFMNGRIASVGHQEMPNFYWVDKGCNEKDLGQHNELKEVKSLSGCAVLYRKNTLKEVNYFDEDFNMYLEDVDICLRLRTKGCKIVYVPKSLVYHMHHGTSQEDSAWFYAEKNRLLLIAKHYPRQLNNALLGKGYFTAQRDIDALASLYNILSEVVLKLIKHHRRETVREILEELFKELKRISHYENSILIDKIGHLLESVDSSQEALKDKDKYITSLELEITKRDQLIQDKDRQIQDLNLGFINKDKHITSLELEITKRGQLIQDKDRQIQDLNLGLINKDNQLTEKEQFIFHLNLELNRKDQEIKSIYNSTAFRFIVRPLWAFLWKMKQAIKKIGSIKFSSREIIKPLDKTNYEQKNIVSGIGICTIISKNYLAYARVLAESFLAYNQGEVFVLLTDKIDGYFDPQKEKFTLIELDTIKDRIPDFSRFSFQYNTTELNTAVKPFFLEFLFEKYQMQKLVFFDPDILITDNLNTLFEVLDKFSIILTPHITRPFNDNIKPTEIDILKSGVYNLGFIALSHTDTTKNLLQWWQERLRRYCTSDIENGLFVDQKWIDLIPGFFEDVFILRDTSYNIAYWNYHYRKVYMENAKILIDNTPVKFLHFSGFEPQDSGSVSKHQDRYRLNDVSQMRPIYKLYRDKLITHGYNESKDWPCIFNYFDNGVKIPDIARKLYWQLEDKDKVKFGNPFHSTGKNSYFNWLNKNMDTKRPKITRLMYEIYKKRPDVQLVYRDIFNSDREAFVRWFLISTKREYHLDDLFLEVINSDDTKYVWMGLKPRIVYKIRNIFRLRCKRLFKNNLNVISKLRRIEILLYKKITIFSRKDKSTGTTNILIKSNDRRGVNIFGYINSEHGVGEAVRANIKCLKAIGMDISLINITPTYIRQCDSSFSQFSSKNPFYINLIHINADMFPILCAGKGRDYFEDKYNIGFWTWELPDFPDEWRRSFDYYQEIWVPSSFSLTSILKKSSLPVIKIPHAVSINKLKDVNRSYFGLKHDDFIFLFIFDFMSYFERKNPLAIIEAFKKSFLPSQEVKLVIKCCNSSFNPKAMKIMRELTAGLNIEIIDKYLYKDEVNALISLCDCYISLHRSEGFGLTMAEAMFLEKPVIATGYSGNMDFMNINNSYPVKYKLVQIDKDAGPYKKGSFWAEPDIRHAAELMRYVYENREASKETGKLASEDIKNEFNYDVIGRGIKKQLDYIYERNYT